VDADSEVTLSLTWAPVEVGSVREIVHMRADQACRLQFVIIAAAKRDVKRTRKVCSFVCSVRGGGRLLAVF